MYSTCFIIRYLSVYLLFGTVCLFAQDSIVWQTRTERLSDTEYMLRIAADIPEGQRLYNGEEIYGITFTYNNPGNKLVFIGSTKQPKAVSAYDPLVKREIACYTGRTDFKQLVIAEELPKDLIVTGKVNYSYRAGNTLATGDDMLEFGLSRENGEETEGLPGDRASGAPGETGGPELWRIFVLSFLGGFAALLTPCVFPMIPLTVSFFTKRAKSRGEGLRDGILFGISIMAIYVLLGTAVTAVFGAGALNALSTNVWFNLFFFLLLVVFAFSFLGAFELVLPHSWVVKVDSRAHQRGITGILFMALALAIVSFSCTGPIVGTLLVDAATRGGIAPVVGMLGFSLALALPFALFATFPGWLRAMPKSGGWLNTVKVTLGFLELAFAFKFLSNADLVLQLHWLERETFLAIWIVIFGVMALYLLGKIRLPLDREAGHISVSRLALGLCSAAFAVYMLPGLWGAPLQLISGFPPPLQYSESPYGVGYSKAGILPETPGKVLPDGAEPGPHDIPAFTDYDKGLAYAKKVNKPVLLDFTGYACVNCRKMEERVWAAPGILDILKNEVVLVSLYVDDKRPLPEAERVVSEITGKELKYRGQKWSEFQQLHYKANAQPLYVLIDHEENKLNASTAYNPDIEQYRAWLREGIENFKRTNKQDED